MSLWQTRLRFKQRNIFFDLAEECMDSREQVSSSCLGKFYIQKRVSRDALTNLKTLQRWLLSHKENFPSNYWFSVRYADACFSSCDYGSLKRSKLLWNIYLERKSRIKVFLCEVQVFKELSVFRTAIRQYRFPFSAYHSPANIRRRLHLFSNMKATHRMHSASAFRDLFRVCNLYNI